MHMMYKYQPVHKRKPVIDLYQVLVPGIIQVACHVMLYHVQHALLVLVLVHVLYELPVVVLQYEMRYISPVLRAPGTSGKAA